MSTCGVGLRFVIVTLLSATTFPCSARLCARYLSFTIQLDKLQKRTFSPRVVRSLMMVLTKSDDIATVDKNPAEVVVLQPAVINEELPPLLLGHVRVLELEKKRIDTLEIVASRLTKGHHSNLPITRPRAFGRDQ